MRKGLMTPAIGLLDNGLIGLVHGEDELALRGDEKEWESERGLSKRWKNGLHAGSI